MPIYVSYTADNKVNVLGIDRVSKTTLFSNVSCILVWMTRNLYVNGEVNKSKTISKKQLLQYIQIPSTPSKTYKNLLSDPIKHAFGAIEHAGWTVHPDWTCRKGASNYVCFTKKWFNICDEFMAIPTGFVTNKEKLLDYVKEAIMEYIVSLPQPPPSLDDPLELLPQLNSLPCPGEDLKGKLPPSDYGYTMDILEDSDSDFDSDSEPEPEPELLSMDF